MKHTKDIYKQQESSVKPGTFFPIKNDTGIQNIFFQPKLEVGPVDDVYEREANVVAEKVMRKEDVNQIQRSISSIDLQRKGAHCEEEEHVQRKASGQTNQEAPSLVNDVISSSGRPLDGNVKASMETQFGYDFSDVKIHTDERAANSAQSIQALAYTSGNSIVFNKGQYAPGTKAGDKLLAHELTHVVQQGGSDVKRVVIYGDEPDPRQPGAHEQECEDGTVNDDRVNDIIDEALELYKDMDTSSKLEMAYAYLRMERDKHCCDYDYAAAEHYMWARKEVNAGWPLQIMMDFAIGYQGLKFMVPNSGVCPKTQPNSRVAFWGVRGAIRGDLDFWTIKNAPHR